MLSMNNDAYIDFLETTARRMDLLGENSFRVRAYARAARALEGISSSIDQCIEDGTITDIDGIGEGIATELKGFKENGTTEDFERLKSALPPHIDDLFKIQGLGPKRIRTHWKERRSGSVHANHHSTHPGNSA